jgi:hypothetical protein
MQTIKNALTFPSGTPIDSLQAKIGKVYPRQDIPNGIYGPTSVQSAYIEDATGNKMKFKIWGHPDIAKLEGTEVVFQAGKGGKGLLVKQDTYTVKSGPNAGQQKTDVILEAGKSSTIQNVGVFHNTAPATSSQAPSAPVAQPKQSGPIHGATAGEATKLAVEILIKEGQAAKLSQSGELEDVIVKIGVQIARAHLRIESGEELRGFTKSPASATSAESKPSSHMTEGDDQDVPF